eukprot:scaffold2351_cov84-Skeletonema_dohrnii-CCMP3373.AAC.13
MSMLDQERFASCSVLSRISAPPQNERSQYTNARDVVIDFIVRQMMRRSPQKIKMICRSSDKNIMRSVATRGWESKSAFSNGVSVSDAASDLEKLQVILHLAVEKDEEGEQAEVILDARHRIPFHEEIRAQWEQFVEALGNNTELEHFQMTSISFPPSPFFAES